MSCLEELFSVILRKLMPLGKYYRKRPLPFSLAPSYRGANAACKSTRTGLPAPAPYPPFPNRYQGSKSSVSLVVSRKNAEHAPRPSPSFFGLVPGGTDQIRLPVPKADSVGDRPRSLRYVNTPGKQSSAAVKIALPLAATAGAPDGSAHLRKFCYTFIDKNSTIIKGPKNTSNFTIS